MFEGDVSVTSELWPKYVLLPPKRMQNFETLQSHIFDSLLGVLLSNLVTLLILEAPFPAVSRDFR